MDFGDLKNDTAIQAKLTNLHISVQKLSNIVELALKHVEFYDKLTTKEKVDFDLFIAYTLNTLYWVYLKTRGEDPNNNEIKNQLNRIKSQMLKAKAAHERNTIRPKLDKEVSVRFIKHGISHNSSSKVDPPPNKKTKFC